jgi:hypothetical protein
MYLEHWTLIRLGKEAELTPVTMLKCVEVAVAVQRGLDQLQKVAAITVNIKQTRGESYCRIVTKSNITSFDMRVSYHKSVRSY